MGRAGWLCYYDGDGCGPWLNPAHSGKAKPAFHCRLPFWGRAGAQNEKPAGRAEFGVPCGLWLFAGVAAYSAVEADRELLPDSDVEADSLVEAEAGSLVEVEAGSLVEVEAGSLVLATPEDVEAGVLLLVVELQATRPSARTQAATRTANIFFII